LKRLREVLERVAPPGAVEAGLVLWAWRQVAEGEGLGLEADYRAGRLTVVARTSAQAQELALLAPGLRERVNALLGRPVVREVRVLARGS
jgi:hypothetical protein